VWCGVQKLNTKLKNKTCTNSQIKNHKKSHKLRLITPNAQLKNPEHMCSNFLTPPTPSVDKKCVTSWVHVSL
jgi:hypothetical protein